MFSNKTAISDNTSATDTLNKKKNPDDMIPDALFNGVTLVVLEVSIQFL